MKRATVATFGILMMGVATLTGCQNDDREIIDDGVHNITAKQITTKSMKDFKKSDIKSVDVVEDFAKQIWKEKEDGLFTITDLKKNWICKRG